MAPAGCSPLVRAAEFLCLALCLLPFLLFFPAGWLTTAFCFLCACCSAASMSVTDTFGALAFNGARREAGLTMPTVGFKRPALAGGPTIPTILSRWRQQSVVLPTGVLPELRLSSQTSSLHRWPGCSKQRAERSEWGPRHRHCCWKILSNTRV